MKPTINTKSTFLSIHKSRYAYMYAYRYEFSKIGSDLRIVPISGNNAHTSRPEMLFSSDGTDKLHLMQLNCISLIGLQSTTPNYKGIVTLRGY